MAWIGAAASVAGGLLSSSGGSNSSSVSMPGWYTKASKGLASQIQSLTGKEYTPYGGQRIAALDPNQTMSMDLARQSPWQGALDQAGTVLGGVKREFNQSNLDQYMNPYIKSALDPVAREATRGHQMQMADIARKAPMRGSFGGSRTGILEAEAGRNYDTALNNIYGPGYARAFDTAAGLFNQDRSLQMGLASQYGNLAGQQGQLHGQQIQQLMQTGALGYGRNQALLDVGYQDYEKQQMWPYQQLQYLTGALGNLKPGSTTTGPESNPFATALGTGLSIYGTGQDQGWWGQGTSGQDSARSPMNISWGGD